LDIKSKFDHLHHLGSVAIKNLHTLQGPIILKELRRIVKGLSVHSSLSLQDLLNITSITSVKNSSGHVTIVDLAQKQAAKYFEDILLNNLDVTYLKNLFGDKKTLPPNVEAISNEFSAWFKKRSLMNAGQVIYDQFRLGSKRHKKIVDKIDIKAIEKLWIGIKQDKEFDSISSRLYTEGYRDAIPAIHRYLPDGKEWAKRLFDVLTDRQFLKVWMLQNENQSCDKIGQQMYEWYVQLSVLDPTNLELPRKLLSILFGVVLNVSIAKSHWTEELKSSLTASFKAMIDGKVDSSDTALQKDAAAASAALSEFVSIFSNLDEFSHILAKALSIWMRKRPDAFLVDFDGSSILKVIKHEDKPIEWKHKFEISWKKFLASHGLKYISAGLYGTAGTHLLFTLATDHSVPLSQIPQEINLGLLATGKVDKIIATSLGNWLNLSRLEIFAKSLQKWITNNSMIPEIWAKKMFGNASAKLFSNQWGSALAILGISSTSTAIWNEVVDKNNATFLFEPSTVFFELSSAVGLEPSGFAWVGHVGLAIAASGSISNLVHEAGNNLHAIVPHSKFVEEFVNGPLALAGLSK